MELNAKVDLAVDELLYCFESLLFHGASHYVIQSEFLIKDIEAEYLPADRAYDSNALIFKSIA